MGRDRSWGVLPAFTPRFGKSAKTRGAGGYKVTLVNLILALLAVSALFCGQSHAGEGRPKLLIIALDDPENDAISTQRWRYIHCRVAKAVRDIAHLAQSTPTEFLFTSTDFNSYVTVSTAEGAPQRVNGRMAASTQSGLGIAPRMEVLGAPVVEVG
jgi:hypothetical protein